MAAPPDLTEEEFEALLRIRRGSPESRLVPATVLQRLVALGLAVERRGERRLSDAGRQLILRAADLKAR